MNDYLKPDRPLLESRLASLVEALDTLEQLRNLTLEEYRHDVVRRSAVERLICRLVEVAAEANSHISAKVLNKAPSDYHDSFLKAAEAGALGDDLSRELARSAGLRNRIVHEYEVVDHALVHSAIAIALDQFRRYVDEILEYVNRLEQSSEDGEDSQPPGS